MQTELFFIVIIIALQTSLASVDNDYYVENDEENSLASYVSNREERLVTFLRIRIPAPVCDTGVAATPEGYCDGFISCLSYYGKLRGFCKNGIGVCCLVLNRCGKTLANRISYFTNKGYIFPKLFQSPCAINVTRYKAAATQLRIDFIDLDLEQPTEDGVCQDEKVTITGHHTPSLTIPDLCGTLSGSHVYAPFRMSGIPIVINITLNDPAKPFLIKLTQITDGEDIAAPTGCLQYYYNETGVVESFNYAGSILLAITYNICLPSTLEVVTWKADVFEFNNIDPNSNTECVGNSDYLQFSDALNLDTNEAVEEICYNFPVAGIESWSNVVTYVGKGLPKGDDAIYRRRFRLTYVADF